ncbi:MAG: NAD(P)-dependent oxidoreductase [Rhodospirillaceae bacterium]|nr:NAD(P)-dependent oxidoreductase [Rhodospirillaceae bacterium]MBT4939359.1 NAD(P)-dependent oxidoreductase [Rhodospirillaceae bacterium]MBT7268112.1 NAD(P)-dependent oxidoreductase [Rhodospirillaceae bacterium]
MTAKIGFIGLGIMGMPMVLNFLKAGTDVTVWGRSPEKMSPAVEAGATLAASPKALAEAVDVLFTCVFDADAVEEIIFAPDGLAAGASADMLMVDCSSIHPERAREIAARLKEQDSMSFVDCPVSGGRFGARDGTLVLMAGGEESDIERIRPIVPPISDRLTHMGPVGCGQATKLVNQTIIGAEVAVMAEMFAFADNYGVKVSEIPGALAGGWADSTVLQDHAKRMINAEYWSTAPGNMLKDMNAACDMGRQTSSPMPVSSLVSELYRFLGSQGDGDKGQIGLMYLYKQDALK